MTMVCIYHIDTLEKKHIIESSNPITFFYSSAYFPFVKISRAKNRWFGAFLNDISGARRGKPLIAFAGIVCSWNTKWPTWSVRRCVHVRNERKSWRRCVNEWSDMADIDSLKGGCGSSKFITPLLSHLTIWFVYWVIGAWHLGSSKKQRFHCLSPLVAAYDRPKTLGYAGYKIYKPQTKPMKLKIFWRYIMVISVSKFRGR